MRSKRILSLLLAIVMVFTMMPMTAFSTEKECVYLSISFDGTYINDQNGDPIVYLPIPMDKISAVDLTEYGLDHMRYDADGDGSYEITALQLLIYAHEELYGGDWEMVNFDALPGASYFAGGIFGFTENLVYFHNGDFPVDENQQSDYMTIGATSDRIVLEAGDFLDVASFDCYSFLWDQQGGFHLFADPDGNYVHDYIAEKNEPLSVKLKHSFCDLMFGNSWVKDAADYDIYYGSVFGEAEGIVQTDEEGNAEITFSEAGTYYVWCDGGMGTDDGTHGSCEHYSETYTPCIVSAPAYARVTVSGAAESEQPEQTTPSQKPETPEESGNTRQPQDVSGVLNAAMAKLASTVTEPAFGTNAGEWTVFGLARGNYFEKDDSYFTDYYDRIVETVNETAASVNLNGALDKNKSTDNSRLITALSAIGKDATSVGDWDLVEPYSANGINWIKRQGMNGTIWTLIALDSGNYETSDPTIRQQCVDAILSAQHNDGGWSLVTAKTQPSNVDITGMALTALYPYRDQSGVADACETALVWLSESQLDNGGFPYGNGETSESCVWAIVAAATWGINPDTDSRFIKNGNSAIDNLLTYYLEDEAMFEHGHGAGVNAMATDQSIYGLAAYDRFIHEQNALFDFSDVDLEESSASGEMKAGIRINSYVSEEIGTTFSGFLNISKWDPDAGFKMIDFIILVPKGILVKNVTAEKALTGGDVQYHLEEDTGKLRVVYFDANKNKDIQVTGSFPLNLFKFDFEVGELADTEKLVFKITGMSFKRSSDSSDTNAMVVVNTEKASVTVNLTDGPSLDALCLYQGDDVDLIPKAKKAVAVAVTNVDADQSLTYNDGEHEIEFLYSGEISEKTNVSTYVAVVDASIEMESFVNPQNFEIIGDSMESGTVFGDTNADNLVNAEDALATVNAWLRKSESPSDQKILAMNVNGDSRINTYDALGIVEYFIKGAEFGVVTKATLKTN